MNIKFLLDKSISMTAYTLLKNFCIGSWLKLSVLCLFFVGILILTVSQLCSSLLGMRQFDFRLFYNSVFKLPNSFLNSLPLLIFGIITIALLFLAFKSIFIFPLLEILNGEKTNWKTATIRGLNLFSYLIIIIAIILVIIITLSLFGLFSIPLIFPNVLFQTKGNVFVHSIFSILCIYLLTFSIVSSLVFDLQTPYILFQNMMIVDSLRKVLSIIKNNFSSFLYYYVVKILALLGFLSIWGIIIYHLIFPLIDKIRFIEIFHFDLQKFTVTKMLFFLVVLSGLLLIIRYLFALVFLPIIIFFRYYALAFLAEFDEQFESFFTAYYKKNYQDYFAKHYQEIKIE